MNDFDRLNAALFVQMDRLEAVTDEDAVKREVERAKAVSSLAGSIIGNAKTAMEMMRLREESCLSMADASNSLPRMLGGGDGTA